jgi:ATP-dependent Lon protease
MSMDEKQPNNNSTLDLPLLITRGLFVFPNMTESIEAARAYSVAAIDNAPAASPILCYW